MIKKQSTFEFFRLSGVTTVAIFRQDRSDFRFKKLTLLGRHRSRKSIVDENNQQSE